MGLRYPQFRQPLRTSPTNLTMLARTQAWNGQSALRHGIVMTTDNERIDAHAGYIRTRTLHTGACGAATAAAAKAFAAVAMQTQTINNSVNNTH